MKLDTEAHTVTLSNKDVVTYGKLLLATGANVHRLRVDGGDLDGIHYLRTLRQRRQRSARTPRTPSTSCSSAAPTSPPRSRRR